MKDEWVMTEVRSMARRAVKDELKRQGVKVSDVEAADITKAANHLIKTNPKLIAVVKRDLVRRAKQAKKINVKLIPRRKR